jgi:hypothetical protein
MLGAFFTSAEKNFLPILKNLTVQKNFNAWLIIKKKILKKFKVIFF